jgi:hypothetical protein
MNRSSDSAPQSTFDDFVELSSQIINTSGKTGNDDIPIPVQSYPPKVTLSLITGKIRELRISKSLVRQLIYNGNPYPVCPYKVYHTALLRDITTAPSDSQLKGMYFESKCIGSSVGGDVTSDLPRHKKTGAKLADHERIDQAIAQFFLVVEAYGLIVDPKYTQIYRKRLWNDPTKMNQVPVYLDGTLDFMSPITTPRYSHDVATIDLKLTKDRDVTDSFSNGLFHATPWGNMEKADFSEAMMYRLLFDLPFVYLVFDFKKENPGFKDIPIITDVNDPDPGKANLSLKRMNQLYHTLRWVTDAIFRWESQRWPMEPNTLVCSKCVVPECPKRLEKVEI